MIGGKIGEERKQGSQVTVVEVRLIEEQLHNELRVAI